MKITIHRYGGIAGTNEILGIIEVETLSAEKQKTVREALDRLKQQSRDHRPEGADFIKYELLVEDAARQHTVSFSDDGSEKAQQLVKLVTEIANAGKKQP